MFKFKDLDPQLRLKEKIQSEKLSVKGPMAEFLTVECHYKRVKKDITKAWRKADTEGDGDSDNPEEKPKTRPPKRKAKKPEAEDPEAEEPAVPKAAAKPKANKRTRRSK